MSDTVSKPPQAYILRGIPGAGKSYIARGYFNAASAHNPRTVSDIPGAPVWVSSDNYFMEGMDYVFDPAKLSQAHAECLRVFLRVVQSDGRRDIIVDNTNLTTAECAPYTALADACGYQATVINIPVDLMLAYQRQIHGVPFGRLRLMERNFREVRIPPWWKQKWFLRGEPVD